MANLLAEYEARPGRAIKLGTTWVFSLDQDFSFFQTVVEEMPGPMERLTQLHC